MYANPRLQPFWAATESAVRGDNPFSPKLDWFHHALGKCGFGGNRMQTKREYQLTACAASLLRLLKVEEAVRRPRPSPLLRPPPPLPRSRALQPSPLCSVLSSCGRGDSPTISARRSSACPSSPPAGAARLPRLLRHVQRPPRAPPARRARPVAADPRREVAPLQVAGAGPSGEPAEHLAWGRRAGACGSACACPP